MSSKTQFIHDILNWGSDPHKVLGLHSLPSHSKIVRLYRPGATSLYFELFGKLVEGQKVHQGGLFALEVPSETTALDYRVYTQNGQLVHDPYAFLPTFGEIDAHLFQKGVHYKLHEVMGARAWVQQGVSGFKFALWAPAAQKVALVGDFNLWDGRVNPMRQLGSTGVWELFMPAFKSGEKYKFEIHTQEGFLRIKSDPYALYSELRPLSASVTFNVDSHTWNDQTWMEKRQSSDFQTQPMTIYEVHLGSWRKRGHHFLNYREIALELADYCQDMGFTHVQLLPISEHPLDESWGYQVTGFFATTSRYGTPEDFQFFVDYLHQKEIGVILDWVPAHFPTDDFSLAQFDGSYLYEHADPRQGFHPHWNTYIFNYGRYEVTNFLLSSALFWLDKMHVDGLRVDAVASMLYLDYGRSEGEWIPNAYGGKENLEAIEFLKHLNSIVHETFPHVLMIAEESTSFMGVTHSLEHGGLGFDMKWNMGWMNDTLRYFHKNPLFRSYHQNDLTFSLLYAYSERFTLPLSHDEVVHGKGSLLSKMPGDDWQKFANLRLLYSYQLCHVGKKLLFMGAELGQWEEWNCKEEIAWNLLKFERHQQLHLFFKDMNHFYLAHSSFWQRDFETSGFEWIDFSDRQNAVISYWRKTANKQLLIIHNFTPNFVSQYDLGLANVQSICEVFNTDKEEYGGSGKINKNVKIVRQLKKPIGIQFQLSPLATMCFEVQFVL